MANQNPLVFGSAAGESRDRGIIDGGDGSEQHLAELSKCMGLSNRRSSLTADGKRTTQQQNKSNLAVPTVPITRLQMTDII